MFSAVRLTAEAQAHLAAQLHSACWRGGILRAAAPLLLARAGLDADRTICLVWRPRASEQRDQGGICPRDGVHAPVLHLVDQALDGCLVLLVHLLWLLKPERDDMPSGCLGKHYMAVSVQFTLPARRHATHTACWQGRSCRGSGRE
jgi:hypothetical protein